MKVLIKVSICPFSCSNVRPYLVGEPLGQDLSLETKVRNRQSTQHLLPLPSVNQPLYLWTTNIPHKGRRTTVQESLCRIIFRILVRPFEGWEEHGFCFYNRTVFISPLKDHKNREASGV